MFVRSFFARLCLVGLFISVSPFLQAADKAGIGVRLCNWALGVTAKILRGDRRDGRPAEKIDVVPDHAPNALPGQIVRFESSFLGQVARGTEGLTHEDNRALSFIAEETDFQSFLDADREYFRNLKAKDVNRAIDESDLGTLNVIFGNLDVALGALDENDYFELTALSIKWKKFEQLIEDNMVLLRSGMPQGLHSDLVLALLEDLEMIFDRAYEADMSSEYIVQPGDSFFTLMKKRGLRKYHEDLKERNRLIYNKVLTLSRELRKIRNHNRLDWALPAGEFFPRPPQLPNSEKP